MIYGGDLALQMPIMDLYDKQIMAMSINAAKDMYEKGQKQIDDFYSKYGDFISPIQKDMDWYNQNVTGRARDTINNLYAQGIDPLRSAEGRAAVAQLIYSMPTGDIAKVKQSAEAAKEYIKNRGAMQAKGLWNPDYERAILNGGSLEDWDTMNGGVWTRTAPSEYQDLNQYTSHIFDNLKDSYIGTDKNHYDWYGVTENDLYRSLTPDKLGGLLNTDLGRFHYSNAIRDLAAQGNLNPSEAEKMEQFRKNIVAANHERVHQDRKINELWKMQQEHNSRMSAARASKTEQPTENTVIGFTDRVKYAIKQKQSSGGQISGNKKYINVPTNNNILSSVLNNWDAKTVAPQGYDQEEGAKLLFYGYTERSQEAIDVITGRKSARFTFVPNSGLHYTPLRMYDHSGMEIKGRIKSFDDYLHKNHVYGYPVDEPVTITNDVQSNSNIYDANGFLQIESGQIDGYFKERYHAVSGKNDYDSDSYEKFKKNQMRQLGIVENVQTTSKTYTETDGRGVYIPEKQTYYTIPVSRTARIVGLGQSAIDTRVDKSIMSGKELGEREKRYQSRDYKRKSQ